MGTPGVKTCPFCGVIAKTFYTYSGTIRGYPRLVANIKCPACGIQMSMDVPCCMDEKQDDYGQTPFEYAGIAAGELAEKWNKRANE